MSTMTTDPADASLPDTIQLKCCNVAEGATLIGIARSRMAQLLDTNQIRSWRMGRRRIIPLSEIRRYIDSQLGGA